MRANNDSNICFNKINQLEGISQINDQKIEKIKMKVEEIEKNNQQQKVENNQIKQNLNKIDTTKTVNEILERVEVAFSPIEQNILTLNKKMEANQKITEKKFEQNKNENGELMDIYKYNMLEHVDKFKLALNQKSEAEAKNLTRVLEEQEEIQEGQIKRGENTKKEWNQELILAKMSMENQHKLSGDDLREVRGEVNELKKETKKEKTTTQRQIDTCKDTIANFKAKIESKFGEQAEIQQEIKKLDRTFKKEELQLLVNQTIQASQKDKKNEETEEINDIGNKFDRKVKVFLQDCKLDMEKFYEKIDRKCLEHREWSHWNRVEILCNPDLP